MELPLIGLGTWELRGVECTRVVQSALDLGYQHLDTAHIYENHQAIRKAIQGRDRTRLYLTSKIAAGDQVNPANVKDSVRKACEQALQELGTDYLDLYLIHFPNRAVPLEQVFLSMEALREEGKIIRAGVSNYTIHHLEDLRKAGGKPFANQVEFHPYLDQKELLDYCRAHQIRLISFRSFGKGKLLKEEPLFDAIGSKYHKTGAQVILRWLIQQEIAVIPKTTSPKHLKQNLEIFDFSLTEEEMKKLSDLNQNKRYCLTNNPEFEY